MFQLTLEEVDLSRSHPDLEPRQRPQHEIPPVRLHRARRHPGRQHPSIPRAVEMSVYVVRAFVKLREVLASNKELAQKLDQLERKLQTHDQAIVGIFNTIRKLMASTPAPPHRIHRRTGSEGLAPSGSKPLQAHSCAASRNTTPPASREPEFRACSMCLDTPNRGPRSDDRVSQRLSNAIRRCDGKQPFDLRRAGEGDIIPISPASSRLMRFNTARSSAASA